MCHLRSDLKTVWYALCVVSYLTKTAGSQEHDPLRLYYQEEGDINLGVLLTVTAPSHQPGVCGTKVSKLSQIQMTEAVRFAVQTINQDPTLLQELKLGFVILDDCFLESSNLINAVRFVPTEETCQGESQPPYYFAVEGVVGCQWSKGTALSSLTLAPYSIPLISPSATSGGLSNKIKFPNVFRLVPPDRYQAKAMLKFIISQGWKQISILYSGLKYGLSGYRDIMKLAKLMDICIGAAIVLRPVEISSYSYCVYLVKFLLKWHAARVVIVFGGHHLKNCLFDATLTLGAQSKFVWICSDDWTTIFADKLRFVPPALFVFTFQGKNIPGFVEYLKRIQFNTTKNPWIHAALADIDSRRDRPCNITEIVLPVQPSLQLSITYDAIYTYAYALNNLIRYKCSNARTAKIKDCLCHHRLELIDFIKRTQFRGISGNIEFDETGSLLSKYNVLQVSSNDAGELYPKLTAVYDIRSEQLFYLRHDLWEDFENIIPKSTCTEPCQPGEIKRVFSCCWECTPCKEYEIATNNNTQCSKCGTYEKPDPATGLTTCKQIPRKFLLDISHPWIPTLIFLTAASIVLTKAILIAFLSNKSHTAIKATNLGLSLLQMISILIGYAAIVILLQTPWKETCCSAFSLLSFSFNMLYAATLLKAIELKRIFSRRKKETGSKFISGLLNTAVMVTLALVEVALSTLFNGISEVKPALRVHYSKTGDEFVEIFCHFPALRVTMFVAVHLILLLLCSYFSFRTRKLPNRFNESSYVALSLFINTITWLAVLPAFNVPHQTNRRTLFLCYIVILNHLVALVCFFLSRLFQLYTNDDAQLQRKFAGLDRDNTVSTQDDPVQTDFSEKFQNLPVQGTQSSQL